MAEYRQYDSKLRSEDAKGLASAVADGEATWGACQGGEGGGGGVGGGGRGGCHPVHQELALPCLLVLCALNFRRTADKVCHWTLREDFRRKAVRCTFNHKICFYHGLTIFFDLKISAKLYKVFESTSPPSQSQ